ncbi:arginine N-succinyltransferase [Hahella sp. KA22]|uniref:arginine N-succinyltransferase n=1 Tax=Hahella sp. KA22 TaxID=1628392 RepID=UPI000FDD7ADA|nr:arginine N-succinyltransferase [Hahella sp. KA22]AZZ93555.1 arginine N-succinyltransferase [Hahella sp. KA22]QAY56930.1 arginine N-succinyltransferase [Hahella sp. KA22]
MMIIRPISSKDLDAVYELAKSAGIGVTTLPANRELLSQRIEESERSFSERIEQEHAYYMFGLEDTKAGTIVGVSAIKARVGLDEVWYNYRVSTTVNASKELGIHKQTPTLYLTNDMTNCSEICTLFLHEKYRNSFNGQLLSKCRFLFLADFSERFSNKIFAEMRGYTNAQGESPFWEDLGRKFFSLEFSQADYLSGIGNKAFIAELMPKYPIYVPFFSQEARDVIGQVHEHTRPALAMLESEGFNFNGLVDIFDAGPLVESFVHGIRSVRDSAKRFVMPVQKTGVDEIAEPYMISNRSFSNFRVGLLDSDQIKSDTVSLNHDLMDHLQLGAGDTVRVVALKAKRSDA